MTRVVVFYRCSRFECFFGNKLLSAKKVRTTLKWLLIVAIQKGDKRQVCQGWVTDLAPATLQKGPTGSVVSTPLPLDTPAAENYPCEVGPPTLDGVCTSI